jgi:transcriptional regulator with XRE-family HTH domain
MSKHHLVIRQNHWPILLDTPWQWQTIGMKTVEHLFELTGLAIEDVAEKAGLPVERVAAIAEGRWTPSPDDRARIAAAFGVPVEEVSWGHSMNPRNIRYRRHGLKENF